MSAKTAAERMKEFRQRRQREQGLKYTEVYVPKESLDDANGVAVGEGITLREVLTRAVVRGLKNFKPTVTIQEGIDVMLDEVDRSTLRAINKEADTVGKFVDFALLEGLILDGIAWRQSQRVAPKPKRGRPAKTKMVA